MSFVRLLLLHGSNPLDVDRNGNTPLARAKDIAQHEMKSYLENPIRYRSDCSALIALSIGLASLELPVLVMTIISEYLVSINEEKLFADYPEHKNWKIAALVKKNAILNKNTRKSK